MKKRLLKILAVGISAVMGIGICLSFAGCGDSDITAENAGDLAEFTFDTEADPPATKGIVYVEGTWEEMGLQYGQQAKDAVQRGVASGLSSAISQCGSYDKAAEKLDQYTDIIEERTPELLDLWKGMAEGAEIEYEHLLISEINYNPADNYCSTVSVWGDKAKDSSLIAGVNSDGGQANSTYTPAVAAFPDEGNAFISYNGFITNAIMNEKGLVVMGSQGQEGMKEDYACGPPPCTGVFYTAWKCDTAAEAKDMYIKEKLGPGSGENFHASDTSGDAFVVEHTACIDKVRTDEDFGSGDYTIATNGFLIDEMWEHLFTGEEFWDDDMPRYWTEEKIIQDAGGEATIDTINNAIGCTSYYINPEWITEVWEKGSCIGYMEMENGVWEEDVWDLENYTGFWTPENREPGTKCVQRTVMDPGNKNMYVMNGCRDTNISVLPEGTGNFWRLTFGKNFKSITQEAKQYAQIQLYIGERDVDAAMDAGTDTDERAGYIKTAKSALLHGNSYYDLAGCTSDRNEQLTYMAKAATEYGKAQCYAQKAQNDPSKLIREGEGYEVY